jgi:hypothetical protein
MEKKIKNSAQLEDHLKKYLPVTQFDETERERENI